MRIAVPVKNGKFSPHFGRSDGFDLFVIDRSGRGIASGEHRPLVPGADCHDFARCVADLGVELVIAGGIGKGAIEQLEEFGVKVVAGAPEDDTRAIVAAYLAGTLAPSSNGCEHEGERHDGHCQRAAV